MLTFKHVHFYYKKSDPILKDLTFTIEQGEFVAIVGANGCGKSTIAKLMDGLLVPKQGSVCLGDLDTTNAVQLLEIRKCVGLIFQNPEDQFITTTVRDEILFGLENIRVPREEMDERIDRAIRMVGMELFLDAMPHELSGGQKQRVAIASILAMKPQVIMFDEATSMVDPLGRKQIVSYMRELHKQGITVIHITHHMDEVLHADRVLLIADGQLQFDGDPMTLFSTVNVQNYRLVEPFAVRLHRLANGAWPLTAHWEGAVRTWVTS